MVQSRPGGPPVLWGSVGGSFFFGSLLLGNASKEHGEGTRMQSMVAVTTPTALHFVTIRENPENPSWLNQKPQVQRSVYQIDGLRVYT